MIRTSSPTGKSGRLGQLNRTVALPDRISVMTLSEIRVGAINDQTEHPGHQRAACNWTKAKPGTEEGAPRPANRE